MLILTCPLPWRSSGFPKASPLRSLNVPFTGPKVWEISVRISLSSGSNLKRMTSAADGSRDQRGKIARSVSAIRDEYRFAFFMIVGI